MTRLRTPVMRLGTSIEGLEVRKYSSRYFNEGISNAASGISISPLSLGYLIQTDG